MSSDRRKRKNKGSQISVRPVSVRVKTARGRKLSSTRWLQRQLNDPYVAEAKRLGYRSRAAFKLIQMNDKYGFLQPGQRVIDLGCAPGGWLQVAKDQVGTNGMVMGMDLLPMEDISNVTILQGDFMAEDAPDRLRQKAGGAVDIVLSDMAPATTGHAKTDHLRIIGLVEAAAHFATEVLCSGGVFVAKVFAGGTEQSLLQSLKRDYARVVHFKPQASRQESAEIYVVAMGFRGEKMP